nr:MAG TPA: hypothetical protein [Caudoviricetes sp.]
MALQHSAYKQKKHIFILRFLAILIIFRTFASNKQ